MKYYVTIYVEDSVVIEANSYEEALTLGREKWAELMYLDPYFDADECEEDDDL